MERQREVRRTQTETATATADETPLVLRLAAPEDRRVHFSEDVVDNEHMGKKKSKKCCVFHKRRRFDESDTESEGEDTDSDMEFYDQHPQLRNPYQ